MPTLDSQIITDILNTIGPFAVTLGVVFATAEAVFQWFMRIAFGKGLSNKSF